MQAANQEALRFNHERFGTEHVLLALIVEGRGVAANVLRSLNIDLRKLRHEIETLMQVGPRTMPRTARLPQTAHAAFSEPNAELRRLNLEKERAVAEHHFERAAMLRDLACKIKLRKQKMSTDWLARQRVDAAWLSWGGGAVFKLAQRINERCRWDALPELANVLEQAACTDADMLGHCRQESEHSSQCWVVDLLLAHAPRGA
jgi:Clp amino terminal domain, pathogenicity island component/UvrB/uvrC motif